MAMPATEMVKNAEMPKEVFGVQAQRVPVMGGDAARETAMQDLHMRTRGNDMPSDNRAVPLK